MTRDRLFPLLALLALAGCGHHLTGTYSSGLPVLPRPATLLAGGARVDLTPPPGIQMGGFSWLGRRARGHWLRIRGRAVVLHAPDGGAVAIVASDLWSLPGGLPDRVAERLARSHPDVPLRRAQLLLGASHSHHSPGNISTDRFFGTLAQGEAGFHASYFEWVAERLASATAEAWRNRSEAELRYEESTLSDVMRNRSLEPFLRNPEAPAILRGNAGARCEQGVHADPRVCAAVDRRLRAIRAVSPADGSTLALVGVVALHPTTLPHTSALYSSDVFGAAATAAERRLAAAGPGAPVVALLNGPQGDVSPTWSGERSRDDVMRIAGRISERLLDPSERQPMSGARIEIRRGRLELRNHCFERSGARRCTSRLGYPGRATTGGAEDGRVSFRWPFQHEGARRWVPLGRQGRKLPALQLDLGPITLLPPLLPWVPLATRFVIPPAHEVELALYRIGATQLVALPGEFTTVAGRRVVEAVRTRSPDAPRALAVGLANGYAYYTATAQEYRLQHYEGSGTLYGRAQAEAFVAAFAELAAGPRLPAGDARPQAYRHPVPREIESDVSELGGPACRLDDGVRNALGGGRVAFARFEDATLRASEWAGRTRLTPRFHAEARDAPEAGWRPLRVDGLPEDDDAPRFVATAGPGPGENTEWCAFWVLPPDLGDRELRICMRSATQDATTCAPPLGVVEPGQADGALAPPLA